MRTNDEFRSGQFPACPGEDERIHEGRWGQRLAEYLQVKLKEQGIFTKCEIGFEDWGCRLDLAGTPFPMWIGCGNYEEFPDGHLCFIGPSKPTIWGFPFRKLSTTTEIKRVADALDKIFTSDSKIQGFRWWSEDEK